MIMRIIDFLIEYFSNINARKIFGGILVLLGLALLSRIVSSGNTSVGIMYVIGGILVGGVGLIIVFFDMAKDKTKNRYNELDILTKAYGQTEHNAYKAPTPDIGQSSDEKNAPSNS